MFSLIAFVSGALAGGGHGHHGHHGRGGGGGGGGAFIVVAPRYVQPIIQPQIIQPQIHRTFVQPIRRTFVQPIQRTFVQPVQRNFVQPIQRTVIQPVQRTIVQPVQRTIIQPVTRTVMQADEHVFEDFHEPVNQFVEPVNQFVEPLGYDSESVEERIVRTPLSKTMTEMPDDVRHIKHIVNTHYPMLHEQVTNHYTVQDEQNNKFIHHYYNPKDNFLGMRSGHELAGGIQDIKHPGESLEASGMFAQPMEHMVQQKVMVEPRTTYTRAAPVTNYMTADDLQMDYQTETALRNVLSSSTMAGSGRAAQYTTVNDMDLDTESVYRSALSSGGTMRRSISAADFNLQ